MECLLDTEKEEKNCQLHQIYRGSLSITIVNHCGSW